MATAQLRRLPGSPRCPWSVLCGPFAAALLALCAPLSAAPPFLIVHPDSWQPALAEYTEFKTRLGYDVTNVTTETLAGGGTLTHEALRAFLADYETGRPATHVLLLGNFTAIPAPSFRVIISDASSQSDIVYRDLHTDFDRDGDGVFGEFDLTGVAEDFDGTTFDAAFEGISNDLHVGRMPFNATASAADVEEGLRRLIAFEREVGERKQRVIMSAGRIDATFPADSWQFVVKPIVSTITNACPEAQITTVVHMAPTYADRSGVDYAVEGNDITGDYVYGQDIVRALCDGEGGYGLLSNVSHGGSNYDFALTRTGTGLPTNTLPAVIISMSCASFPLGRSAFLAGVAAAYFGSTATVTPDIPTFVSGDVQSLALERILGADQTIGEIFGECFQYYIEEIQKVTPIWPLHDSDRLRNAIGFQLIGDPTLVYAYDDTDGDGLLDPEEQYFGTSATTNDTDGDGLPDGFEVDTDGVDPVVNDGIDVDNDGARNDHELIAGTDPLDEHEFLSLHTLALSGEGAVISWPTVTGRVYTLRFSTSALEVAEWLFDPAISNLPGTDGMMVRTNAISPGGPCFYRIDVDVAP